MTVYQRAKRDMRTTLENAHNMRKLGIDRETQAYLDEIARLHIREYEIRSRRY